MANKLNEGSEFTIPLKNLLSLIAFTGIAVWAYFGIVERIAFLEHNQEMIQIEVEENDEWIDQFKPPVEVQDTIKRVRELELKVKELEVIVKQGN
tara:strand:- start:2174 stop:2458 length:285 start_codon:yes stop_codon:yes gene_type:complete